MDEFDRIEQENMKTFFDDPEGEVARRHLIMAQNFVRIAPDYGWSPWKVKRAILEGQLKLTPSMIDWADDVPCGGFEWIDCDASVVKYEPPPRSWWQRLLDRI